jgi:type II secretory pathway pseudopilin PulG
MTGTQAQHNSSARMRGFTLVEVLLTIGISMLLLALTVPIGLPYYQAQVADETTTDVLLNLRRAHTEARLGKNANSFGVRFFPDHYVTFEGENFASLVAGSAQEFILPGGATLATTHNEFVFASSSGLPMATGTIAVSLFGATRTLLVRESGVITEDITPDN